MQKMKRQARLDIVIGVLAILSIVIIAIESMLELSTEVLVLLYVVDFVICVVFAADFVARLRISNNRQRFLWMHSYEILAMVPAVVFLAAGSLIAVSAGLRALRLIRVVRVIVVIARMGRVVQTSTWFVKRSGLLYVFLITIGVVFIGGFAAMMIERGSPDAEITNFSDALWWSIATVTTVGYGDIVPNTIVGRIMGMGLMVIGIGIMAAFISQVSATIVESRLRSGKRDSALKETLTAEIKDKIDRIHELSEEDTVLLLNLIKTLRQSETG
ncbi:MAG TPA: potassium channel family protein [Dehalococcoidia bacterium]|nr:potassium channel family protein [Dehalococcoidia bacterium]